MGGEWVCVDLRERGREGEREGGSVIEGGRGQDLGARAGLLV